MQNENVPDAYNKLNHVLTLFEHFSLVDRKEFLNKFDDSIEQLVEQDPNSFRLQLLYRLKRVFAKL